MAQLPTVEDVARVAQVSRQTVSNVLNSPEIVKDATRERVEAAIAQLRYRPHASARRLRTRKSSTIGIRLEPERNGISGSVLDTFLHALTEQADSRQMRVLLFTANDPHHEIDQIRRLRDGADVDAFVLTSTSYEDPRVEWLLQNEVPFVTFGRPWGHDDMADPRHRWVDVDGRSGVRRATEHLLARGISRVGYIGWPSGSGSGDDRRQGWVDALAAARLSTIGLSASVVDGVSQGTEAARELLAGNAVDALVCASDSLALGARIAAAGLGKDALPIIGFDDTPVALAIGISSIQQPLDAVAAAVLELLLGPAGNDVLPAATANEEPSYRLLAPRLVERRSTNFASTGPSAPQADNHNRKETL